MFFHQLRMSITLAYQHLFCGGWAPISSAPQSPLLSMCHLPGCLPVPINPEHQDLKCCLKRNLASMHPHINRTSESIFKMVSPWLRSHFDLGNQSGETSLKNLSALAQNSRLKFSGEIGQRPKPWDLEDFYFKHLSGDMVESSWLWKEMPTWHV